MCSETGLVLREDSTESLDLHQEVRQGLGEEETLRIGKVEKWKSFVSREKSFLSERYLLNRNPASVTATWERGRDNDR